MLRQLQNLKKKREGFTIIEVLIVLAIAALILVIVLIAIPQLQRNQRNTARKNDTGRVATAVNEFQSNNNGKLPATAADLDTIRNSVGDLSQYTLTGSSLTAITAPGVTNTLTLVAATSGSDPGPLVGGGAGNPNLQSMQIVTSAECDPTGGGTAYSTNARKVALQYLIEAGGSGVNPVCVNVQ